METEECPRCGHKNQSGKKICSSCHSPTYERYVDCDVCGGKGSVQIDYTDAYESAHPEDTEPTLPCGKCDGTGKLLRYEVQKEIEKKNFARWVMIALDLFDGLAGR